MRRITLTYRLSIILAYILNGSYIIVSRTWNDSIQSPHFSGAIWRMRRPCVPGSFFSAYAKEPGERLQPMQEHMLSLGKTSSRMELFCCFRPTTDQKLRVLFSFVITCSLIHKYHHTTNPKRRGNYTHNKSAKLNIKKFDVSAKTWNFNPMKFVPIRYVALFITL